ncbi:MAG: purine-binding chemotaxis protein CheW [bacterium]|jgi:purine-binding chemotaxis protein CheW
MSSLPTVVEQSQTRQNISFHVGHELFGVDIQCVEEIILLPKITAIPRTPNYFIGITNLRGEVISVIDMRIRFGIPIDEDEIGATQRVIVIQAQGMKLGMLVDKVTSIVTMSTDQVKKSPPLMSYEKQKYIYGSYKINDDSILLLLNHEEIISSDDFLLELDLDQQTNLTAIDESQSQDIEIVKELHVLGFSIGLEFYALEGLLIEEIIEMPKVTVVPEMESFVEGIFHLREQVIPIIRLADRLGLEQEVIENTSPVIIIRISGIKVGLIVEEITEVFSIRENEVELPPSNISKSEAEQLKGIIKMDVGTRTRVVMLLNKDNFLTEEENELLKSLDEHVGNENEEDALVDTEREVPLLLFRVNQERYAIPVPQSNEIIPIREIVPVPKSPPFIQGVINLRGDVISIVDLPKLIDGKSNPSTSKSKILVVKPDEEVAGLIVDDLIGIKRMKLSIFEEPSELISQQGNVFIQGIGKESSAAGDIIILMDLKKTLKQAESYSDLESKEELLLPEGKSESLEA